MKNEDLVAKITIVLGMLVSVLPQLGALLGWQRNKVDIVVQIIGAIATAFGGLTHTQPTIGNSSAPTKNE